MASVISVNAKSVAVNSVIPAKSAKANKGAEKPAPKAEARQVEVKEIAVKVAEPAKEVAAAAGFNVVAKNDAGDRLELSNAAQEVVERDEAAPRQTLVPKVEHAAENLQDALTNLVNSLHEAKQQPGSVEPTAPVEPPQKAPAAATTEPAAAAPAKKPMAPVAAQPQQTVTPTNQPSLAVQPVATEPAAPKASVLANPTSTTIVHNHYHVTSLSAASEARNDSDALRGKLDKLSKRYDKLEKRFSKAMHNVAAAAQNNTQPPAQDVRSAVRLVQLGVLFAQRSWNDRTSASAGLLNRLAQAFSTATTAISSRSQGSLGMRLNRDHDDLLGNETLSGGLLDLSA